MTLYEIVFSGQVVDGAQPDKVRENLAKLFQADAQRLALLFSGRRLVLKSNLDAPAAEKYRSTLERAGAFAQVYEVQPLIEEVELAPPPDAPTWLKKAKPDDGRLQVTPRDAYMAAFVDVDAPDLSLAETGSDMQDPKPVPVAPQLDLSAFSLAPAGSDMGQAKRPVASLPPDTTHLKLV